MSSRDRYINIRSQIRGDRLAIAIRNATGRKFWRLLGEAVVQKIVDRVSNRHRNVHGERFEDYEETYKEAKMALDATPKGVPQASSSGIPDMTLTGKTLDDLQVHSVRSQSVVLGWSGSAAGVVDRLSHIKNYQIVGGFGGQAFAQEEMRFIDRSINHAHDKVLKKYADKPMTIRIGK